MGKQLVPTAIVTVDCDLKSKYGKEKTEKPWRYWAKVRPTPDSPLQLFKIHFKFVRHNTIYVHGDHTRANMIASIHRLVTRGFGLEGKNPSHRIVWTD